MYLVVIAVETPRWRADVGQLRRTLWTSAAGSDLLQHAQVEVDVGRAVLSLYLQAADRGSAAQLAGDLARRTMATVSAAGRWRILSIQTL